jgi:hypothetical protein
LLSESILPLARPACAGSSIALSRVRQSILLNATQHSETGHISSMDSGVLFYRKKIGESLPATYTAIECNASASASMAKKSHCREN